MPSKLGLENPIGRSNKLLYCILYCTVSIKSYVCVCAYNSYMCVFERVVCMCVSEYVLLNVNVLSHTCHICVHVYSLACICSEHVSV